MMSEILFASASDSDLNSLLKGQSVGIERPWHKHGLSRVQSGEIGVLCKRLRLSNDLLQPLVVIVPEIEQRRLFGRISQVRSDLSPLTAWCHLLAPSRLEGLDELRREAELGGLEAAWTGLIVAEALLLSQRPISKLKISACLATQTFAVARGRALWDSPPSDMLSRYDNALQLFRTKESRSATRLRTALDPIWGILSATVFHKSSYDEFSPLVQSVRSLLEARQTRSVDEAAQFYMPLAPLVPDAEILMRLPQLTPEQRVREFDKVIAILSRIPPDADKLIRHACAMVAGFYATVAAGGAPSLSLLESHSTRWPEVTAWAYVLGSIGERIVWTSSFDGLGRLVARELMRTLRLDEPPACDFALDEAVVLFDPQLSDPWVHLRIKQSRIVTVALVAGVNVLVSMSDQTEQREIDASQPTERVDPVEGPLGARTLDLIAEQVWRRLRGRVERYVDTQVAQASPNDRSRSNKRASPQSKLPFKPESDK
jgi:hypothetical protein